MSSIRACKDSRVAMASAHPALQVEDLKTHFHTKAGVVKAVDGVSFTVERAQILGLVGESGSGKSVTGFSIIGLVDPPGRVVGGRIRFDGQDLTQASEETMRDLRGNRIAMIFQDPMMTLNPVLRVETQMVETVLAHQNVDRETARKRARDALGQVGHGDRLEHLGRAAAGQGDDDGKAREAAHQRRAAVSAGRVDQ